MPIVPPPACARLMERPPGPTTDGVPKRMWVGDAVAPAAGGLAILPAAAAVVAAVVAATISTASAMACACSTSVGPLDGTDPHPWAWDPRVWFQASQPKAAAGGVVAKPGSLGEGGGALLSGLRTQP